MECLPDELLLKILEEHHLSAEDIFESAKLVCRKWYRLTNTSTFAHAHLQHTDYVPLFQKVSEDEDSFSVAARHGRVLVSKSICTFRRRHFGSCNGLVLKMERGTLYIVNPVTKQECALPPLRGKTWRTWEWMCGIAYAESSKVYKVVVASNPTTSSTEEELEECCRVLTVGVDKCWRSVPCAQHLSSTRRFKGAFSSTPLVTQGGFLHWSTFLSNIVFTMDVETEVIKETPLPFPAAGLSRPVFLSTGKHLSFLVSFVQNSWEVWEMWEPRIGEWRKVGNFSLEAPQKIEQFGCVQVQSMSPVGWLMYPHVLLLDFSIGSSPWVFPYNLVTGEIIEPIKLPFPLRAYSCVIHKFSLVRPL